MKKLFSIFSLFIFLCSHAQIREKMDDDKDGISNKEDLCPTKFGTKENGGCPNFKEYDNFYKKISAKTNYDKIGKIVFENLDDITFGEKMILVDIIFDTENIVCGVSDNQFKIDSIESKYNHYYFWKANFKKLLEYFPNKIIIPTTSEKQQFIPTNELSKYIDHKSYSKTEGFYKRYNISFYAFNNPKKEKIYFSDLKDVHTQSVEYLLFFIYNRIDKNEIEIKLFASKSQKRKEFTFSNDNGKLELISIKNTK